MSLRRPPGTVLAHEQKKVSEREKDFIFQAKPYLCVTQRENFDVSMRPFFGNGPISSVIVERALCKCVHGNLGDMVYACNECFELSVLVFTDREIYI